MQNIDIMESHTEDALKMQGYDRTKGENMNGKRKKKNAHHAVFQSVLAPHGREAINLKKPTHRQST